MGWRSYRPGFESHGLPSDGVGHRAFNDTIDRQCAERKVAALPRIMDQKYRAIIDTLLRQAGIDSEPETYAPLAGDGSDRPFYRIICGNASYLAAFSSPTLVRARAEAHAAYMIGTHLAHVGVPVPRIFTYDQESGAILFEDLGDRLLFHAFHDGDADIFDFFQQAVVVLADFQCLSREGFQSEWCWDSVFYDRELMITRESNYFSREFCRKFMGMNLLPDGLDQEFALLAERISQCPYNGIIHRDYQSRNLMVVNGKIRIIDYQGARFGPLAYDLASLLNDPYVLLDDETKQELIELYLHRAGSHISLDPIRFMDDYHQVALQRNLQVLGAYAFLTQERGKAFFRNYIDPALRRLFVLLAGTLAGDYPVLLDLVSRIVAERQNDNMAYYEQ